MENFVRWFGLCLCLIVVGAASRSEAHCAFAHPHHCTAKAAKAVIGASKKRARMVWNDPLGTALNPISIIDDALPSPIGYVDYVVKNPDELVELLSNPVAGAIGMPLAILIADGRNAALRRGTHPIPTEVRTYMAPYFSKELLDSVRYTTGAGLLDGFAQGIALNTSAGAITLINVIVFKNDRWAHSPANMALWAHELFHVRQYREMGLAEFAATYSLLPTVDGHIEKPAYDFDAGYRKREIDRVVSGRLLVGLGGRCLRARSSGRASPVELAACDPRSSEQQWQFTLAGELRTEADLCLDVQGGRGDNRTPLQLWPCNGTVAQQFALDKRGRLTSALRADLCVEAAGGSSAVGTRVQVFECNGTASQVWRKPLVTVLAAGDNKCLMVAGRTIASPVQLATCDRSDRFQHWAVLGKTAEIRLLGPANLCLDVRGGNHQNGTPLQLWDCNRTTAQIFEFTDHFQIRSRVAANKCIDVPGADFRTTKPIQIFDCNNSVAQMWNRD